MSKPEPNRRITDGIMCVAVVMTLLGISGPFLADRFLEPSTVAALKDKIEYASSFTSMSGVGLSIVVSSYCMRPQAKLWRVLAVFYVLSIVFGTLHVIFEM